MVGFDAEPSVRYARTSDDVSIAWTSVGTGPPLIHMPGVPLSNVEAEWRIPVLRQAFAVLARNSRYIQYDGRGSGRSERLVTDLSLDAMVRDLDAVLDAAQVGAADLIGFYHSVPTAIAYAARQPDRVRRLVLFGGSTRGWGAMSAAGTQALLSLIDHDWNTFVESATHAWLGWPDGESGRLAADWFRGATTPEVAREVLTIFSRVDVTSEAARVRQPALVLHRRDATVIPLAVSEELAATLPNGRLRILDGSSASLFFERQETVVREILAFFNDDGAASAPPRVARSAARGSGLPTPRELEVLRLLAQGETNAQIAGALGISVHTVERHLVNLYRKIDARGRADATAYAVRRGLA